MRIQFRSSIYTNEDTGEKLSGRKAFKNFQQLCEKHNINLEKYKCSEAEGLKAKEEIAKPWIKLEEDFEAFTGSDFIYENMHHVDIRSSYPAGLAETHPEFRPVIQELFDKRKDPEEGPKMKATLVYIIGFMQSKNINYCYAKLSRDAINKNDAKIRYLREVLIKSGRQPILYNTDGIWYQGKIYHGYGEGDAAYGLYMQCVNAEQPDKYFLHQVLTFLFWNVDLTEYRQQTASHLDVSIAYSGC